MDPSLQEGIGWQFVGEGESGRVGNDEIWSVLKLHPQSLQIDICGSDDAAVTRTSDPLALIRYYVIGMRARTDGNHGHGGRNAVWTSKSSQTMAQGISPVEVRYQPSWCSVELTQISAIC
jgi:hypothetical protein